MASLTLGELGWVSLREKPNLGHPKPAGQTGQRSTGPIKVKLEDLDNIHKSREMVTLKRGVKSTIAPFLLHLQYVPQELVSEKEELNDSIVK